MSETKKKMGRPAKEKGTARYRVVQFNVSDAERTAIMKAAKEAGKSTSKWCVDLLEPHFAPYLRKK